jgi:hypothetical protein
MDFLQVLFSFIIIGVVVSVAISYLNLIAKPYVNIKKYSMTTGAILSFLVIFAYNKGILTALEIPIENVTNQPWFHYTDLFLTAIIGSAGANGVHRVTEGIKKYIAEK